MSGLAQLQDQGRMTWAEREPGWVARPDDVMEALGQDGFEEARNHDQPA